MSTKANPGPFDRYAALAADEPYFLLVARREADSKFVRMWAAEQRELGNDGPEMEDAFKAADAMDAYRDANAGTSTADQIVLHSFRQWHSAVHPSGVAFAQCLEPICVIRKRALAEIANMKP